MCICLCCVRGGAVELLALLLEDLPANFDVLVKASASHAVLLLLLIIIIMIIVIIVVISLIVIIVITTIRIIVIVIIAMTMTITTFDVYVCVVCLAYCCLWLLFLTQRVFPTSF